MVFLGPLAFWFIQFQKRKSFHYDEIYIFVIRGNYIHLYCLPTYSILILPYIKKTSFQNDVSEEK